MDPKNDHNIDACYRLLALCARAESHLEMDRQLLQAVQEFTAWSDLPGQAELHGMGPLLWHHIRRLDLSIPEEIRKTLNGLYLRHRVFHQEHKKVLLEITVLFEQHHIRAMVLKGLALAYEYYPDPILRPSSDIDLLLKKEAILTALKLLEEVGYKIPVSVHTNQERMPNELIVNSSSQNGLSIHIELHHDDSAEGEFFGLDVNPHGMQIDRHMVYIPDFMDHLDYLVRHLTRHMFASTNAKPLPLKWITDIVSMVERHAQTIDWEQQTVLLNRLEMFYSLTPFPERLSNVIPIKRIQTPNGINQYPQGWPQYSFSEWKKIGFWKYIRRSCASPSDWWLRLYYGIPAERVFWFGQVVYRWQVLKMALSKLMSIKQ